MVDGRLTEAAWATAEPAGDFIQFEPHNGQPAIERTEVRILYDDDTVYLGVVCHDSDMKRIRISSLEEDFDQRNTDVFGFVLDTLHDRQTAFGFFVNPAGARRDTQSARDGDVGNVDWDGVWDVATTMGEHAWFAEFAIPFRTLRFRNSASQEWGFNAVRRVPRINEDSTWSPLPVRVRSIVRVSLAGTLTGLDGIRPSRNLKVKPFAIGSIGALGPGNPFRGDRDAGLDVKYGLTRSVTLDASYRTDFSQVEVDQQQVNLTRFNLLFPEKREFFLENRGVFSVAETPGVTGNVIPFFTRRIGLSEGGTPIPIVGGARMSGRAGDYDVGLLAMKADTSGAVPSNDFLIGRVRRNLPGASTIGAIVTSRDSSVSGDFNRLYGVDSLLRLADRLEVASYLMATDTPGRRGNNLARLLGAAWRGDRLTLVGQYEQVQPGFTPEAGFVRRTAMTHYNGDVAWRPRSRRSSRLRNYIVQAGADYYQNPNGDVETRVQTVGTGFLLQSGAQLVVEAEQTFDRLVAPFPIPVRRSVVVPVGDYAYRRYSAAYNSDQTRKVSVALSGSAGEFWNGTRQALGGTIELRPSYRMTVTASLSHDVGALPSGEFRSTLAGIRAVYGFTTRAFLTSFLQYNAAAREFSGNTRFNLIHRPLSDLYVVYNERRNVASGTRIDRAVIVKFTNLFDF